MLQKLKILFLCTGNSCRSQMAEAWTRRLKGDEIEPYSAGIAPQGLDSRTAQVMAEVGIDVSAQHSTHVEEIADIAFDYVVTVCDHASETCPVFPGRAKVLHVGFEDPPRLAVHGASEEDALSHYRRVREEIRTFILTLPEALTRLDDTKKEEDQKS